MCNLLGVSNVQEFLQVFYECDYLSSVKNNPAKKVSPFPIYIRGWNLETCWIGYQLTHPAREEGSPIQHPHTPKEHCFFFFFKKPPWGVIHLLHRGGHCSNQTWPHWEKPSKPRVWLKCCVTLISFQAHQLFENYFLAFLFSFHWPKLRQFLKPWSTYNSGSSIPH